jgi:predicted esterase
MRAPVAAAGISLLCLALGACAHVPRGRVEKDVTFTVYSPLSRNEEILRRITTPLGFREGQHLLAAKGEALRDQPVDLARERFTIYVPAGAPPPGGWGLLVFVAPWPQATEPKRWRVPLDRHGVVMVSAARSGNQASVFERRVPLALLAWENVRARLPIDPARVYVGGMSGGARVAQALALAWPDVFRGALLNAGSQPIGGERGMHLPPAELFRRFQATRVVYATGGQDEVALQEDQVSQASLREWCVLDQQVLVPPRAGHEPLDAPWLDRALAALEQGGGVDPAALARCNERLERELAARLADVEAALARGDREGARARLHAVDAHYAGFAGPAVLALDAKLSAAP